MAKNTDAETLLLSLPPDIAKALDKARGCTSKKPDGKQSRTAFALMALAAAVGIEGYQPRKRGRPAAKSN